MPIREFVCTECGRDFEKIVRMSTQAEEIACPSCGGHQLEKKLSGFAAHTATVAAPGTAPRPCGGGMCSNPGMCGMNPN